MNKSIYTVIVLSTESTLDMERFDSLLSLLAEEKKERILRIRSDRDAQNCLLGDVLTRMEISNMTGLKNEQIVFMLNKYGKPYLKDYPDIHFNISHSGHYVAVAFDNEPVGIDVEMLKKTDGKNTKPINIAKRFFAPDEIDYILSAASPLQQKRFFEIWTKKEALIKREGIGLSKPLHSFSVLDCTNWNDSLPLTYHKIFSNDEAVCHLCCSKSEPPPVRFMDVSELDITNALAPVVPSV